jgi:uncharacterized protein
MRFDELNQPLRKRSLFSRLWEKRPGLLFCAYVAALGGMGAGGWWAVQQKNPFAGEPLVVVSIPPAEEIKTASTSQTDEAASAEPVPEDVAQQDESQSEPSEEIVTEAPEDTAPAANAEQDFAMVTSPRRPLTPSPQTSITEMTSWGALPKISGSGDKASSVYARKVSKNIIHSDSPKIALLLGGMGLNKKLTQKAIKDLPGEVTLAFAPYGNDLQEQVDKARGQGHEVFLQVPLEPVGYPASNPGPKTLVGDASEAENMNALRWHMSRFHGYAGVVNYMGGRFLAMPKAMKPVLSELKQRGIYFLEDGSMALSSTETAAKQAKAQVRRAKVVIDIDPSPQAIISALTLLEEQATGTGFAVGTGSGLEVTIDTVRDWAKAAAERGIVLVPITAAYKGQQG